MIAFNQYLADRIRIQLANQDGIVEKQMFGGLSFLLHGNIELGVIGNELCVRVDPANFEDLLARARARIFDFTGRPI